MKAMSSARWVVVGLGVLAATTIGWLWRSPVGTGEYLTSPDSKVVAHVSDLSRGTLWGRERYLQLELRLKSDEMLLLSKTLPVGDEDVVPDYQNRALRHLKWAPDSGKVVVKVANGQSLELVVPTVSCDTPKCEHPKILREPAN